MVPKVKFELAKLKHEARMLSLFCSPLKTGWDWSDKIFRVHPLLKENLGKAKTRKKSLQIIRTYTKNFWREEFEQLTVQKFIFQKEWNKINYNYMNILSKILQTSWPKDRRVIHAQISIIPICPRFLENWAFSIFYLKKISSMRETVAHEVLHFLYFKKWKEVFPDAKEKTFDAPHLEWALSEILAPVILNDKRIQKIIRCEPQAYPEYLKTKINKKTLIQHFENLYNKSQSKGESFSQFLESAYKEAQKYKHIILNI